MTSTCDVRHRATRTSALLLLVVVVVVVVVPVTRGRETDLRVGAFNVRIFGQKKMSTPAVVDVLVQIIKRYDVILIQEVRDSAQTAISRLVHAVNLNVSHPGLYRHVTSARLGRTSSKEQYSYIYRSTRLTLLDAYQYDDSANDLFEREPFSVKFRCHDSVLRDLILIGIHTDPDKAVAEMDALVDVHSAVERRWGTDDILIMGDLNADCDYASGRARRNLALRRDVRFHWLIDDSVDTTVTNTDCTYDRFIATGQQLNSSIVPDSVQVFHFDREFSLSPQLALQVSDHYPIELLLLASHQTSGARSSASRRRTEIK